MNRSFNAGHSALRTLVLALAMATVTLALGGFGSGCGSKTTQQLNNRGRIAIGQGDVQSQTNNGDATGDVQNKGPSIDPTPTSVPQNNPTPLPMSNLTWDGKSNLGTADLQVVPLN